MDPKELGAFIARMRKEAGMSQGELAEKLQVTNRAVSRWETGAGFPEISSLCPLAEALGISIEELMMMEKKGPQRTAEAPAPSRSDEILAEWTRNQRKREKRIRWIIAGIFLFAALLTAFYWTTFPVSVQTTYVGSFHKKYATAQPISIDFELIEDQYMIRKNHNRLRGSVTFHHPDGREEALAVTSGYQIYNQLFELHLSENQDLEVYDFPIYCLWDREEGILMMRKMVYREPDWICEVMILASENGSQDTMEVYEKMIQYWPNW